MRDVFTKKKRSEVMSLIKSKGTKIETKFRQAMCCSGLKGYRINPKMYSNPDFVFKKYKVIVFCDGEFWHGKNYSKLKPKLRNKFWREKIENNIRRDKQYVSSLKKEGWTVLRFWEADINKKIKKCIAKLIRTLEKKKRNSHANETKN